MTEGAIESLRRETVDIFYHGYENYMHNAFPEDELKPLSCTPLTRKSGDSSHVELNDVLGNYSLTLIDSLSTLAILASSDSTTPTGKTALDDFQAGVAAVVQLYGDGTDGPNGQGTRSRGFDLDSKVQVFETVIRGLGGLLSAHLFAIGELPIKNYNPPKRTKRIWNGRRLPTEPEGKIAWRNGFLYNDQLLRLAYDLATRLLPAFDTNTGLPYPRVNLRHGIPFYPNAPNFKAEYGTCEQCEAGSPEITETCSAGAGSLVLEFSTLSRLTDDPRFEELAITAFHAVWARRSVIGLVGSGIDAETGNWVSPYTGIGAGIDSFFEYAMKSHILLSGSTGQDHGNSSASRPDFLTIWQDAHAGISRHIYRDSSHHHPHYIQTDLYSGATRAFWIDSLSAYYPGLLTLAGELDEAIETHLLYAALWTRYGALPERWSHATGAVEHGLRWWGGRPEFIESTWYLYQATHDPWYLHVAEMVLRDIKKRCWTPCGWAGLEDVRTGELKDRMESFFLGETSKYLYLLFDHTHPLNTLDAPIVFTTEGHPLIIPASLRYGEGRRVKRGSVSTDSSEPPTCPVPQHSLPFTISPTASRSDLFHAASLARLHQIFKDDLSTNIAVESAYDTNNSVDAINSSPNNFTFYPWTLPTNLIPLNGTSSKMNLRITFDLAFPILPNSPSGVANLQRVEEGIMINSVSGLKIGMIREKAVVDDVEPFATEDVFRIHSVAHLTLGRDEKIVVRPEVLKDLNPVDPFFTRHRELSWVDLVVDRDVSIPLDLLANMGVGYESDAETTAVPDLQGNTQPKSFTLTASDGFNLQDVLQQLSSAIERQIPPSILSLDARASQQDGKDTVLRARELMSASVATGIGATHPPDVPDASSEVEQPLVWTSIYMAGDNCINELPAYVPSQNQVIVIKRGNCSFGDKLRHIPSFAPTSKSLQLVVVVSYPKQEPDGALIRPLLDSAQTTPSGMPRFNPISMVMVQGGDEALHLLGNATGIGMRRKYHFTSQGLRISNLVML